MTQSTEKNLGKTLYNSFDNTGESAGCGCGCGCSTASEKRESGAGEEGDANSLSMRITIDGQELEVAPEDKNIVDVASRAKIGIPAACYQAGRSKGSVMAVWWRLTVNRNSPAPLLPKTA